MTLREELCSLAEPAYGDFQAKLMPGVPRQRILGVRLPQLRRIAARIARSGGSLPEAGQGAFVEEVMLEGMVLGRLKDRPTEELLALTAAFVPKIDNWAVCDTFCAGLIWAPRRREEVWAFLQPYFDSGEEYPARFAAVMAMDYFFTGEYFAPALERLAAIRPEAYYTRMAVAWAYSMAYVQRPQQTLPYLSGERLPLWTRRKALQKILESRRITPEQRGEILSLRAGLPRRG